MYHSLHRHLAQLLQQVVRLGGREKEAKGKFLVVFRANGNGVGASTQVDDFRVADDELGLLAEHVRVEAEVVLRQVYLPLARDFTPDVAEREESGLIDYRG